MSSKIYLDSNTDYNNNNNNCYICLEQLNYYYKFNCSCHIYIHSECIEKIDYKKCIICQNLVSHSLKINLVSSEEYLSEPSNLLEIMNIDRIHSIIKIIKLNSIVEKLFQFPIENIWSLVLNVFFSFLIMNFLLIPIVVLNILFNLIKYSILNLKKTNPDYLFLILSLLTMILIIKKSEM